MITSEDNRSSNNSSVIHPLALTSAIKAVDSKLTMEKCVLAEIRARSISISEGELRSMNLAEKWKKICKNEFDNIPSEQRELTEGMVKDFTPKSDEMKHFIDPVHKVQEKIRNFEKGIDNIEASLP